MQQRTISNTGHPLQDTSGTILASVDILFELVDSRCNPAGSFDAAGEYLAPLAITATTDEDGIFDVELTCTDGLIDERYYLCTIQADNCPVFRAPLAYDAAELPWVTFRMSAMEAPPAVVDPFTLHMQDSSIHAGGGHSHANSDALAAVSGVNTGDQDLSGLLDETAHDLLDHAGLPGIIALGTPSSDAQVLSSLTDGTRSWISHNDIHGLDGGNGVDEFYHLANAQYEYLLGNSPAYVRQMGAVLTRDMDTGDPLGVEDYKCLLIAPQGNDPICDITDIASIASGVALRIIQTSTLSPSALKSYGIGMFFLPGTPQPEPTESSAIIEAKILSGVYTTGIFKSIDDCRYLVTSGYEGDYYELLSKNGDWYVYKKTGTLPVWAKRDDGYNLTYAASQTLIDTSALDNDITVTLPVLDSTYHGKNYFIKRTTGTYSVIVDAYSNGFKIDGQNTYAMDIPYESLMLVAYYVEGDNANGWYIV